MEWGRLHHAYGEASLTESHLNDLISPDAEVRKNALSQLFMSICHQGTIYPATIKAIPVLIDILKKTPYESDGIAALLATAVSGEGYYRVHRQYIDEREENILKRDYGIIIADEVAKENEIISIARIYANECWPMLLKYITSIDSSTRECVVIALGVVDLDPNEALKIARETMEKETDKSVTYYLRICIDNLVKRAQQGDVPNPPSPWRSE